MQTLIALDLETTGLDPATDTIIEIGAVRFRGKRVEGEYSQLVNPGRPLPAIITQITGINDEMLSQAPRLQDVLPDLEEFVEDFPILGHSVRFDLDFLGKHNLFQHNLTLDSFDLASVLLPDAGRYSLVALAAALGVPLRSAHRALDDANATRQVFLRLYDELMQLPMAVLSEITRLGENTDWGAGWAFEAAYDQRINQGEEDAPPLQMPDLFTKIEDDSSPLTSGGDLRPLEIEELAALVEPSGPMAEWMQTYEHRPQQVTMLEAVARALSEGRHLLVEAGTGIGKSMAYLIPSLQWAHQNGQRVVISTNTINLQDQLIHNDIPMINKALDMSYRAAVLKGRANYLCPRRLQALRQIGTRSPEEIRLLSKLLVWLSNEGSGDRGGINLPPQEAIIWSRLSADNEECSTEICRLETGGLCPYYQAQTAAENAHVVIINHALLLADIATGNRVVPDYDYLIVDEAHHLESAATNGLSFSVTEFDVIRVLRDLGSDRRGLLGRILDLAKKQLQPAEASRVEEAIRGVSDHIVKGIELSRVLFGEMERFLESRFEGYGKSPYARQFRVMPGTRTIPEWEKIEIAWDELRLPLSRIIEALRQLAEGLEGLGEHEVEAADTLATGTRIAGRSLEAIFTNLDQLIFEPEASQIYWLETSPNQSRLSFHAAPLQVGPLVQEHIWHKKEAVVMTSATLTTAGEFDYLRRRLGAEDAEELALGSPFDYESATLLYLVNDIPEPSDRQAYQRAIERGLLALCSKTNGRTLALFTSHRQLRRTAHAISEPLARQGIQVLEQTTGASRHALLESFKADEGSVLLGTRSYWEGVDVPGEALSVLVITKLPFDVPSDPIVASRSEMYESPFYQYTVPEAILRFRQGFGRLIRTRSDRGVVLVMDRRVLSKSYGRFFIESLPQCTVRQASLKDAPRAAARWLQL
jgi:DNA polymerase-3 subunit epsilon/ATP-dependent DNA helicase DinG